MVLYAHNFTGYDSHLLIAAIKKDPRITKLEALPRNQEKMRTITMNSFYFRDSLSFLDGSLANVVDNLVAGGSDDFHLLYESGICFDEAEKKLLLRKGE